MKKQINSIIMGITITCRNTEYQPYGTATPRVPVVAPDDDNFLPPNVPE